MNTEKRKTWFPILICWLAYTSAYLGRYSYASNITAIIDTFGVTHSKAGLVSTFFFFAYGIGQVINGILCKRYNKRFIIPFALLASSALNLTLFLGIPFRYIKYVWLMNGVSQSILWSTLICILSETLASHDLQKAVIVMSTTVPIGTFLTYGFSSLMAVSGNYTYSFLLGSLVMLISAFIWIFTYKKVFTNNAVHEAEKIYALKPKANVSLIILIVILGIMAVANNLVKDGLTTWIPSILKEKFSLSESLSILLTLTLPILGLFGATCNTFLEKKIKSFISLSGIWYLLSMIFISVVLFFINTNLWLPVLVSFGFVSLFMHGVNNLITSMAPLYMRDRINSGLLAGVLNGCCYVGSTISSYGLGSVADRYGWNGVVRLLLMVCLFMVIISVVARIFSSNKKLS